MHAVASGYNVRISVSSPPPPRSPAPSPNCPPNSRGCAPAYLGGSTPPSGGSHFKQAVATPIHRRTPPFTGGLPHSQADSPIHKRTSLVAPSRLLARLGVLARGVVAAQPSGSAPPPKRLRRMSPYSPVAVPPPPKRFPTREAPLQPRRLPRAHPPPRRRAMLTTRRAAPR